MLTSLGKQALRADTHTLRNETVSWSRTRYIASFPLSFHTSCRSFRKSSLKASFDPRGRPAGLPDCPGFHNLDLSFGPREAIFVSYLILQTDSNHLQTTEAKNNDSAMIAATKPPRRSASMKPDLLILKPYQICKLVWVGSKPICSSSCLRI